MDQRHTPPICQFKAEPSGYIEGYGSVFGNVDSYGDVVQPGAFKKSLEMHRADRTAPAMLWAHNPAVPIGVWNELSEDDHGLRVQGQLALSVAKAREAFDLARAGALGFSIGFNPMDTEQGEAGNLIYEVKLLEVSLVSLPANSQARVTAVKAAAGIDTLPAYERFLADSLGISRREAARLATKGWQAYRGESA
ncbi:MAG: HK97 family phage prohead protease [Pseudomonadota bacterium]